MATQHRILVTGAGGFVGHWLLQALRPRLPAGALIRTLGRSDSAGETLTADVTNAAELDAAVASVQPTCVLHLAAIAAVDEARRAPRRTWDVNLGGTMNLAESVLRHAPEARFLFVSTSEVYGGAFRAWNRPLDETAPMDPANAYAASKAAADLLIGQMARDGLKALRLRPFNHTGPGQTEQFVIPTFAAQIARIEHGLQEPVIRVGSLDAQRDFLDVRDVVEAYTRAILLEIAPEPGTAINIASSRPRRIGEVLDLLVRQARVEVRVEQDPARMRPNDTPVAVGDASRAKALLDWEPTIPFERTIEDVLEHWRVQVKPTST